GARSVYLCVVRCRLSLWDGESDARSQLTPTDTFPSRCIVSSLGSRPRRVLLRPRQTSDSRRRRRPRGVTVPACLSCCVWAEYISFNPPVPPESGRQDLALRSRSFPRSLEFKNQADDLHTPL
ncbi:hypothetical protein C8R46DRAFT_1342513, partial [Mycena filopes]